MGSYTGAPEAAFRLVWKFSPSLNIQDDTLFGSGEKLIGLGPGQNSSSVSNFITISGSKAFVVGCAAMSRHRPMEIGFISSSACVCNPAWVRASLLIKLDAVERPLALL